MKVFSLLILFIWISIFIWFSVSSVEDRTSHGASVAALIIGISLMIPFIYILNL